MATGEVRGAFSMSEPGLGSDVSAVSTKATKNDDGSYSITGQKMWLTNGATSTLVAVLTKTDEGAESVYKNMTTFLVEKEAGFGQTAQGITVPGKIDKMGYKGVETTELILEGHEIAAEQVLGGEPGKGFFQMMDGVEVGRVNVAARACGLAWRGFELAIAYAQQRKTFGKAIAEHQAVLFRLAEMATKVEVSHTMMVKAARLKDTGQRMDVEAGMAKMVASEYANEVVEDAFRIHGGYGYSKEYEIERLMREVKFMLIGEGTSDIQKMIIGRSLLKDYKLKSSRSSRSSRSSTSGGYASAAASAAASASLAASTTSGERTCSIASAEAPSTAASPPAREVTMRRCSVASGRDRW